MKKFIPALVAAAALSLGNVAFADDGCIYKGTSYSDGAASCQAGTQYRCDDGQWERLGSVCSDQKISSAKSCDFGGKSFSSGAASCQTGTQYRCDDGSWQSLGVACTTTGDAPSPKTCMLEGTTVAHNSTVCKTGTTYRCDNGEWDNLGTPCR